MTVYYRFSLLGSPLCEKVVGTSLGLGIFEILDMAFKKLKRMLLAIQMFSLLMHRFLRRQLLEERPGCLNTGNYYSRSSIAARLSDYLIWFHMHVRGFLPMRQGACGGPLGAKNTRFQIPTHSK